MKYSYLKKRLDVRSPLLEERLLNYVQHDKAEAIKDNKDVLIVKFNCVTDEIGNKMSCKVIYDREKDGFGILI